MDNNEIYKSKEELLNFLNLKENFLYSDFSKKYTKIEKIKKNGSTRIIKPPFPNLKKVQRQILDKILNNFTQLDCVYGLSKDKSILSNAKKHKENFDKYMLTLDIENFFPSISRNSVIKVFKKIGFNKENSLILTKICTIEKNLPQGAPTSPYLASLVCFKLDKEIYLYCKRRDLIYTRYFDDISISGKVISEENIIVIEKIIVKNGFKCNADKKCIFNPNDNKVINSIVISKSGLSVTKSYKEELITIYRRMKESGNTSDRNIFKGKFGFYLYINKKEALLFLDKLKSI